MRNNEALNLLKKISNDLSGLFDYFYDPADTHGRLAMDRIEKQMRDLEFLLGDSQTYIELVDDDGEVSRRYFDEGDVYSLCNTAAHIYCFSDCDNTYSIEEIKLKGRNIEYVGWRPGMRFIFRDCETKEDVFEICRPEWDH